MDPPATSGPSAVHSNASILDADNYTSKGERLKSHGTGFHEHQLMLHMYACASKASFPFAVTTEVAEAGDFDDVVLFYERAGATACRLVQVKHKADASARIRRRDLLRSGAYDLRRYFDSYATEIRARGFEARYRCEIDALVVCTNVDLDDELKARADVVADEIFDGERLHRLRDDDGALARSLVAGAPDRRPLADEFLRKLRFAVARPDGDRLRRRVDDAIVACLDDRVRRDRLDVVYACVATRVLEFHTSRRVRVATDRQCVAWLADAAARAADRLAVYHEYNARVSRALGVRFEPRSLDALEDFLLRGRPVASDVVACSDVAVTVERIVQAFERAGERFRLLTDEQLAGADVARDPDGWLVVACRSGAAGRATDAARTSERTVLVSGTARGPGDRVHHDHVGWRDLDADTRRRLGDKDVLFQGRRVRLADVVVPEALDSIRDAVLASIVLADRYELAGRTCDGDDAPSHYVDRSVRVYDRTVDASGGDDATRYARVGLDTLSSVGGRVVVLIGEPGIGKSTALSALAARTLERTPAVRIVRIDLNDHTRRFARMLSERTTFADHDAAVAFVADARPAGGDFETALLRAHLRTPGRSAVLLDGFDEIAPHYREIVVSLVERLAGAAAVWLTSRPQERRFLEQRLGVVACALERFTRRDERTFFRRYWTSRHGRPDADRLDAFVDRLLDVVNRSLDAGGESVAGVPLHCRILAEVYGETFDGSGTDATGLPDVVDVLDLYERFVDAKLAINVEEKCAIDASRPENVEMVLDRRRETIEDHKLLGVWTVFGEERQELLGADRIRRIETCLSNISSGKQKLGIVHSVDNGRPVFVHRTFAEYFAALHFKESIEDASGAERARLVGFLGRTLLRPEARAFRHFFDRLSARADVFRHVLNRDTARLDALLAADPAALALRDAFGRNVLHLAADYEYSDVARRLVEIGADAAATDDLFGRRPIEYASALHATETVDALLAGGARGATLEFDDRAEALSQAAKAGHTNLALYLIETGPAGVDVDTADARHFGRSLLHSAAFYGRAETCRRLVGAGARVDARDAFGQTPLFYACYNGSVELVEFLLARGADVGAVDGLEMTPVHVAVGRPDADVLDALVAHYADAVTGVPFSETVLHSAVRSRSVDMVRTVLDRGADVRAVRTTDGRTAFHCAVLSGQIDVVEYFVGRYPDILVGIPSSDTLPHDAVRSGSVETVRLLFGYGVSADAADEAGRTPLFYVGESSVRLVDALLGRGARVDAVDAGGTTPLLAHAEAGNVAVVRRLLELGADVRRWRCDAETIVRRVVRSRSPEILGLLIARDGRLADAVSSSRTLLHDAVRANDVGIARALIENRADVSATDAHGRTPLHAAGPFTGVEVVDALIDGGADVDATDADGKTPLFRCAEVGNFGVAMHLVSRGADVRRRSNDGRTVLRSVSTRDRPNVLDVARRRTSASSLPVYLPFDRYVYGFVETSIRTGLDVDATDDGGETAPDVAASNGNYGLGERTDESAPRERDPRGASGPEAHDAAHPDD